MLEGLAAKFGAYLLIAVIAAGGLFGWLHAHDQAVRDQARLEYNNEQLVQFQKDQEELKRKMDNVLSIQNKIDDQLSKQTDAIENGFREAQNHLNQLPGRDKEASPLLKETFRELGK